MKTRSWLAIVGVVAVGAGGFAAGYTVADDRQPTTPPAAVAPVADSETEAPEPAPADNELTARGNAVGQIGHRYATDTITLTVTGIGPVADTCSVGKDARAVSVNVTLETGPDFDPESITRPMNGSEWQSVTAAGVVTPGTSGPLVWFGCGTDTPDDLMPASTYHINIPVQLGPDDTTLIWRPSGTNEAILGEDVPGLEFTI